MTVCIVEISIKSMPSWVYDLSRLYKSTRHRHVRVTHACMHACRVYSTTVNLGDFEVTRRVPVERAVERDEIPYPYKVHDAMLRPLLNIMDSASHNPTLCNLLSPIII